MSLLTPCTPEGQRGLRKALGPDCALVGTRSQAAAGGGGRQVLWEPAGRLLPSLFKAA